MGHANYDLIKSRIEGGLRPMIVGSLPPGVDATSWINAALTHVGTDKEVLEATATSTIAAILEAASLGVRFEGPLGEAYLEARNIKIGSGRDERWEKITQLQIQYRGLMKLARKDPSVRKIEAIIVHEFDTFKHQLGTNLFLNHTWDVCKPRGKMVAVYSAIRYHDGFYDFGQPYPMSAVYQHRDSILADKRIRVEHQADGSELFYKQWKDSEPEKLMPASQIRRIPWIAYFPAMAQKTSVRWSAKFWELSPSFERAAALISLIESGRVQDLEQRYQSVIDEKVDHSDGATEIAKEATSSGVQAISMSTMAGLRAQMLAETGVGQGAMDGAPQEEKRTPPETEKTPVKDLEKSPAEDPEKTPGKDPEPTPKARKDGSTGRTGKITRSANGDPSPEEQKDILRGERAEAARYEAEQNALADQNRKG